MSNDSHIFFHIDVNSAFLSWTAVKLLEDGYEQDIREIPAIIGGDQSSRHGIVLAKSIPAGKLGIKTAEPIAMALRKCPNLLIFPGNHEYYHYRSSQLMQHLMNFCPDIEQVSIDECYMDYTPIRNRYNSPEEAANIIRESVYNSFGFTVNIGISDKKVLAKMASDFEKPNKTHTLYQREIQKKMWPLPVSDLYMCGKSSSQQMYKLGIRTIGDLACYDPIILEENLKSIGLLLYNFANGIDDSTISTEREELKGIGNSTTLSHDLTDKSEIFDTLNRLAAKVSMRLRDDNKKAKIINIEIRYSDFTNRSHQQMLDIASNTQSDIYNVACSLFEALWDGNPIRLLGIRSSKLIDSDAPYQMNIFEFEENDDNLRRTKEEKINTALDALRDKYGNNTVTKGFIKKHN